MLLKSILKGKITPFLWKLQTEANHLFFNASLNDLHVYLLASLGDGDSNAFILPAKRMKKKKGKEQVETLELNMLFCLFNFVCLQTLSDQSSVCLASWKNSIK